MALLAVAVVAALLAVHGPSARAQPVASITLPPPGATKQLYPGCNNISLTFPNGTASEKVVQAVTPAGAVEAMWRHNAAQNRFEGFSPAAPQASDLLSVNFLDAVWLCIAQAPPPPPPEAPTATPVPPPAPGVLAPIPGATYYGATSQGSPVEFRVTTDGAAIDHYSIEAHVSCTGGPVTGYTQKVGYTGTPPAAWIVDNAFTISISGPIGGPMGGPMGGPISGTQYEASLSGRFTSPSTAEGDLRMEGKPAHCPACQCDSGPLTWTASAP
jgi:hypothetical protein